MLFKMKWKSRPRLLETVSCIMASMVMNMRFRVGGFCRACPCEIQAVLRWGQASDIQWTTFTELANLYPTEMPVLYAKCHHKSY